MISKIKSLIKASPSLKKVVLWSMRVASPFQFVNLTAIPRYIGFLSDWHKYKNAGGEAPFSNLYPCLFDKTSTTGIDYHYFYQAIWAFKKVMANGTSSHVDVGSDVRYIGMLTAITDVTFVDIRPLELNLDNYKGMKGSILNLPFGDASVASLSCLHVAEHVGLGRYGDAIDPDGSAKACKELQRVVSRGGNLYFSVPIGVHTTNFNAHRVHTVEEIVQYFNELTLKEFSVIDDNGNFRERVNPYAFRCAEYANGLFHFAK